ncbi:hypothetical protein IV203_014157 [Nitzschia inconspicua]|uniref:Transmembrane protein n=1 Tax=Nitzschia inconspicua TaxID=303405 RepID=A0A9K3M6R2_9STRA|nr:hypothetical protein IV203_014157 [Nitzschia inconspicua]
MTIQPNQNQQQQQPNPPNPQSQSHTVESSPSSSSSTTSTTSSNITSNTQQPPKMTTAMRTCLFVLLVSTLLTSCWGCWIMVVSTSLSLSSLSWPHQQQKQQQKTIVNDSSVGVVRKKEPSIELQQQQRQRPRQPNTRASMLSSIRNRISSTSTSTNPSTVSVRTTTHDDTKGVAMVHMPYNTLDNNNNSNIITTKQQHQQSLYHLREQVQSIVKSLVTLEEVSERVLLKVFRLLTHPVVLLDIAVIVFAHAIGSGSIVVLLPPTSSSNGGVVRWIVGSTRRWLRVTGSARRWTRLVSFVLERRILTPSSSSSLSRTMTQLVRAIRNPIQTIFKVVGALWEHRSRYSLLGDYCWYVKPPQPQQPSNDDDQ